MYVDFPLMFGPVTMRNAPAGRSRSLGTNSVVVSTTTEFVPNDLVQIVGNELGGRLDDRVTTGLDLQRSRGHQVGTDPVVTDGVVGEPREHVELRERPAGVLEQFGAVGDLPAELVYERRLELVAALLQPEDLALALPELVGDVAFAVFQRLDPLEAVGDRLGLRFGHLDVVAVGAVAVDGHPREAVAALEPVGQPVDPLAGGPEALGDGVEFVVVSAPDRRPLFGVGLERRVEVGVEVAGPVGHAVEQVGDRGVGQVGRPLEGAGQLRNQPEAPAVPDTVRDASRSRSYAPPSASRSSSRTSAAPASASTASPRRASSARSRSGRTSRSRSSRPPAGVAV